MGASNLKRNVLVTGGTGGIGTAIVDSFLKEGHTVVAADISVKELQEVGEGSFEAPLDLSDTGAVGDELELIEKSVGNIDILVNNAGISVKKNGVPVPYEQLTPEQWHRVLTVNLVGPAILSAHVLPGMQKRHWGRIVNISSMDAKTGGAVVSAEYAASKAGLIALTKSIARQFAGDGVTVNAVAPGAIETPMTKERVSLQRGFYAAQVPVGRVGRAAEVAPAVKWLASEDASYVTGATIDVNGGWLMS